METIVQAKIKLEIYTVKHKSYGDSVETIFTDEKVREYNNYDEVKSDVLKLAYLTEKKVLKGNKEFNIRVCFATNENWCIATYYSYVAPINRHLTIGYCQQYKDWYIVVSNYQKYVGNVQQQKYNLIDVDIDKVYSSLSYAAKCLKLFFSKNKGKSVTLEESVSNDWNGEIQGFREYNGKIFVDYYWQGDSTDGTKSIEFTDSAIKFTAREMRRNGLYRNFTVNFSKTNILDAITNLFVQLNII